MRKVLLGLWFCLAAGLAGCGEAAVCESAGDCEGNFDRCESGCDPSDPGMCTKECGGDYECPSGYHCSTSGGRCLGQVCIKQCDGDGDCPGEMSCVDFGYHTYCVPSAWEVD